MFFLRSLILLYLIVRLSATRILIVVPYPAVSHQIMARSMCSNLAQSAEVVMVTPHPAYPNGGTPTNLTEVDVSDAVVGWNKTFTLKTGLISEAINNGAVGYESAINTQLELLKTPQVQKVLEQKIDLVVEEAVLIRPIMSYARDAPIVRFSTIGTMVANNFEHTHDLFYPHVLSSRVHNLTFWEKVVVFGLDVKHKLIFGFIVNQYERKAKDFFPLLTDQKIMREEVQMTLLNSNALWDGNRPQPLNFVYVGGIHEPRYGELPLDLKSFLDSSRHGVIYVSFGTSIVGSQLPREQIMAMVRVLSQMHHDVLWKWDGDLPEAAGNIRISKWLPQPDVLRHPKVKLFITQAGYHSTEEAISAGVPLLGIPLISDQWYNAEQYVHFKIGERIDLMDITEESFKRVVETVVNDDKYQRNVVRLRDLVSDQPLSPSARLSWALGRARRRAGAPLCAPPTRMSLARYYELELLLAALLVLLSLAALATFALRKLWAIVRIKARFLYCWSKLAFTGPYIICDSRNKTK